jgi:hypothetical protein
MQRSEGRYEKYDKGEVSSIYATRSLSPEDRLNLRNKDLLEIPLNQIDESCSSIIALGFNRITKISSLPIRIIKLELKNNHISKIQNLEKLINLQVLDLSNNRITSIENLSNNHCLQELHLGDNHLKKVENLEMLKDLRRLNLENNFLPSTSSFRPLSLNTKLMFLVLKGNPLQLKYKAAVLALLPKLVFLDYSRVQTSGFNKAESCPEFFSSRFFEHDVPVHINLDVTPKSFAQGRKVKPKSESISIGKNFTQKTENKVNETSKALRATVSSKEIKRMNSLHRVGSLSEVGRIRRMFKNVPIFKDAPNSLVDNLVKISECQNAQEGEVIVQSDSIVEKMIMINKGSLEYQNKTYPSGTSLFSESLIIPEDVKSEVICKDQCEFYSLSKPEVDKIFKLFPTFKEFIMKNYLDRKVSSKDFHSTLTTKSSANLKTRVFSEKTLGKLNLKSLISSRTSKEIGLPVKEQVQKARESVSTKVRSEIESLFKSADPFDFTLDNHESSESDPSLSSLSQKVDQLFSIYLKEVDLARSHKEIEEEAKEFLKNGPRKETELLAMGRESIRKIVNSCSFGDDNLWMYSYVKQMDRACEDIKNLLAGRSAEVRDEIFSCQSALKTLINQSSQSLSEVTIKNYKVILNDCEMLKVYENPKEIILEICGSYFSDPSVKNLAEEVIGLMQLANKLKDALASVMKAQEEENDQKVLNVRQQLQDEGLLLSDLQISYHLFESL